MITRSFATITLTFRTLITNTDMTEQRERVIHVSSGGLTRLKAR
jgi:hypothetical protein